MKLPGILRMTVIPWVRRLFSLQLALALQLLLAALTASAQAPQSEPSSIPATLPKGIRVVDLKGTITQGAVAKFRSIFESVEPGRLPAGAIVLVDSHGGDGLAAIEIGRIVRAAKAHVFVRGRCASACVYVLAGGVVRGVARDRAIGIHSPRLTTFVKGLGVVDINAATSKTAAAALAAGNKRSREYFAEMGAPDALFDAMMATPSDQTRYLDLAELPELGIVGIDPAYLAEYGPRAAKAYRIPEEELVRRILATPEKCMTDPGATFVSCYRRVLRSGE
jgi:hypothetical protein